jgi:hypothetical protein
VTNFRRIAALANEIADKQDAVKQMQSAWYEGDDPCEAAGSDPSDQFILGSEIDELIEELNDELHS